jgi:maleylpyruvate isomerase
MRLHSFFRSSASWRVRIALSLKGIEHHQICYALRRGEHRTATYLELNPQGLLPSLQLADGRVLTQSLAICEYLDEIAPNPPLLPKDPIGRATVRSLAQIIACDIHPIQNLKVLDRLTSLGIAEDVVRKWAQTVITDGLDAFEKHLERGDGFFSYGDQPSLADICLVPQLANARRFGVELTWPRIGLVEKACCALPAFQAALPELQPDAV